VSTAPTIAELYDRLAESLALEAVHLDRASARPLPAQAPAGGTPTLVGPLNPVQPNLIEVLGGAELDWWQRHHQAERRALLERLFHPELRALVFTDDTTLPADIAERARSAGVAILRAGTTNQRVIALLRHVLGRELAERCTLHGVFLDVLGTGILLTGSPAVGKSELALELITRGHSLVADDAPEFSRPNPDTIEGEATAVLKDFLEVRGLGVLNVRAMYGDAAIRHRKRLQLIVHLEPLTDALRGQLDRLNGNMSSTSVLGLDVPTLTLPVAPGRNLAVLVEASIRGFLLARRGYHAGEDLMQRQANTIGRDEPCD